MLHAALSSLLRIDRHRRRALRKALAPCQYVGTMHLIVRYISRNPGASQEEIACFFALDKASAARDAKRLEDMGHIRREIEFFCGLLRQVSPFHIANTPIGKIYAQGGKFSPPPS